MRYLKFFTLYSGILLFVHCMSNKYTPVNYPFKQIIVGSGGGFTGESIEYVLLENGFCFKGSGLVEKKYERIGKLSKNETDQLFTNYQFLNLNARQIDQPGNKYFYLGLKKMEEEHRMTWGAPNIEVPNQITLFYDLFMHQINLL